MTWEEELSSCTPLMTFHFRLVCSNSAMQGWLQHLDCTGKATVFFAGRGTQVYHLHTWLVNDVIPFLRCDAIRAYMRFWCTVEGSMIVTAQLWMHRQQAIDLHSLHGFLPGEVELWRLRCRWEKYCLLQLPEEFCSTPSSVEPLQELPAEFAWQTGGELLPHQTAAVQWMLGLESRVAEGSNSVLYDEVVCVSPRRLYLSFDEKEVTSHTHHPMDRRQAFRFRGGLLCNRVGSGKTATVLRLIVQDQLRNHRMQTSELLPRLPGTLVVVPKNVVRQWQQEILKFCPGLKVVLLTSITDWKALRAQMGGALRHVHMVLTTSSFLTGKSYTEHRQKLIRETCPSPDDRTSISMSMVGRNAVCLGHDLVPLCLMELLHWRRVVIDEIHEMQAPASSRALAAVGGLSADFWWGVTGTPDTHGPRWGDAYTKLLLTRTPQNSAALHSSLRACLMFQQHVDMPQPRLCVHLVAMTPSERLLLQAGDGRSETAIRACCHFAANLGTEQRICSIDHTIESFRDHLRGELEAMQQEERSLLEANQSISFIFRRYSQYLLPQRSTASAPDSGPLVGLDADRSVLARVNALQQRMEVLDRRLRFIDTSLEEAARGQSVCPICWEAELDCITACGHLYCMRCLQQHMQVNQRCPTCREDLEQSRVGTGTSQRVFHLNTLSPPDDVRLSDTEEQLRNQVGSKMFKVAQMLRTHADARESTLLFLQWRNMFWMVRQTLLNCGLDVICMTGNTQERAACLRRFHQQPGSVMLFDLQTSCSGMNLGNAQHVAFLHPICGSASEVQMLEEQAIGRAARIDRQGQLLTVHHFVCVHTAEEVLWREHHDPNRFERC